MNTLKFSAAAAALLGLLSASGLTSAAADTAASVAVVDPGIQYGVWQGWGTSLAWWANVVGGFPAGARQEYMAKVFNPRAGLGLNVARYNIGGGENPDELPPNKSFMDFRAQVPGFEPARGRWDWSADVNQRWVLRRAMQMGVNVTEAFSNSPPYWMTVSGSVTGDKNAQGNLAPEQDGAFADYLAAVAKHFRDDWGVTFSTLEPLNEPTGDWWRYGNRQEGCVFAPARQAQVIQAVDSSLKRAGITRTGIAASDENSIDDGVHTLASFDAATLGDLRGLNIHTYGGGDRARLSRMARTGGKRLWMSEYGDGDASGMTLSREIVTDLRELRPSAWVYWQVVDGGGWGMLVNTLKDEQTTAYTINEKYYVFGQYTRFIRPGFEIVGIDSADCVAAYDAVDKKLIIVAMNDGQSPRSITFDLSRFQTTARSAATTRTSAAEHWARLAPLPVARGQFQDTLPAESVTTYVIGDAIAASVR